MRRTVIRALAAVFVGATFSATFTASAYAQQEIKIGVIYPLTGPAASTGAELKLSLIHI